VLVTALRRGRFLTVIWLLFTMPTPPSIDRRASEVVPEDLVHTVVYRRIAASPRAKTTGGDAEQLPDAMLPIACDRTSIARCLPADRFPFNR
jgi:hypothetical protein